MSVETLARALRMNIATEKIALQPARKTSKMGQLSALPPWRIALKVVENMYHLIQFEFLLFIHTML